MHNYWLVFTKKNELAVDEDGPGLRSTVATTEGMIASWVADWDRWNPNDAPHFAVEYCPKGLVRVNNGH